MYRTNEPPDRNFKMSAFITITDILFDTAGCLAIVYLTYQTLECLFPLRK